MDTNVHVWTLNGAIDTVIGAHAQAGSDLTWYGPNLIASSSLDMTVKLWDVARANPEAPVTSFATSGLALCVAALPDLSCVVAGTSAGSIHMLDIRMPSSSGSSSASSTGSGESALFHSDGAINAICCGAANVILSGDSKGIVRAFDVRTGGHVDLFSVEGKRPVSSLAWSPASGGLLAVNSYDNALRLFVRESGSDSIKLIHTLRGHRSKNMPIRSCFSYEQPLLSSRLAGTAVSVATGSASNDCLVFHPITGQMHQDEPVSTQVLHGHSGSVYSCDFSVDNLLATCSVDGTMRLWSRRG
jgi:WD40 repeat protein